VVSGFCPAGFAAGKVHVHDTVSVEGRVTTAGRALLNGLLPEALRWLDTPATKRVLQDLLAACWHRFGPAPAASLADSLMRTGFHHATLSGLSLGKDVVKPCAAGAECLRGAWRESDAAARAAAAGLTNPA
jgi:hypothetical protein